MEAMQTELERNPLRKKPPTRPDARHDAKLEESKCKTRKNREWRTDVQGPEPVHVPQIIVTDPDGAQWRMIANIRSQGPLDMATVARTVGEKGDGI